MLAPVKNLVSVIIPAYGRPAYLQQAIDSVLSQTVNDLEVIVVDDASPTPLEVRDDQRVRVVRLDSNLGPAGARNVGVASSHGSILAFLDDDDLWLPDRLVGVEEALRDADVCVCWQSPTGRILEGMVHDVILDTTTPSLGATAVTRGAWMDLDSSYRSCEDLEWWLRISASRRVVTLPRQGLSVRRHDGPRIGYGSDERARDSERLMAEQTEYFRSHRRAHAFRWRSVGLSRLRAGDRPGSLKALWRSLRIAPTPRAVAHLVRAAMRPGR